MQFFLTYWLYYERVTVPCRLKFVRSSRCRFRRTQWSAEQPSGGLMLVIRHGTGSLMRFRERFLPAMNTAWFSVPLPTNQWEPSWCDYGSGRFAAERRISGRRIWIPDYAGAKHPVCRQYPPLRRNRARSVPLCANSPKWGRGNRPQRLQSGKAGTRA